MSKVALVTDSACCITREWARRHGIRVIQNHVILEGESFRDHDLDLQQYFRSLRSSRELPTTAHPSFEEVRQVFDEELSNNEAVVYIAVSPSYTRLHDMALKVRETHAEGRRLYVLNSAAASGQMAAAVLYTARNRAMQCDADRLAAFGAEAKDKAKEIIVLDTLSYLARGGRIGRVRSLLGIALSIKPLIGHRDGAAAPWGKVRTHAQGLEFILGKIRELGLTPEKPFFLISDADQEEWADRAAGVLEREYPSADILRTPMAASAGTHMGPGTWSVSWITA